MTDKKIGLNPTESEILENYTEKDWARFSKKWHPFTTQLVKIFASVDADKRADIANRMSEIGDGKDDEYLEMVTHLASLSDNAYSKIRKILNQS